MKKVFLITLMVISFFNLQAFTINSKVVYPIEKTVATFESGLAKIKVFKYESYVKQISYFENGQIQEVGFFDFNNKKIGSWICYNQQGVVLGEASFKDGKKHGDWKIYNDKGQMIVYIKYKKGKKISISSWTEENGLVMR